MPIFHQVFRKRGSVLASLAREGYLSLPDGRRSQDRRSCRKTERLYPSLRDGGAEDRSSRKTNFLPQEKKIGIRSELDGRFYDPIPDRFRNASQGSVCQDLSTNDSQD